MIRIAKKLALKSTRRQRHACLILDHGRLIAQATNNKGHAEQVVLNSFIVLDTTKGCTLISLRIKPNGSLGISKPCLACQEAIDLAKIRRVIYFNGSSWVQEYH